MEIILANTCAELTGTLNKKHGYHIERRKKRFFGARNTRGNVPEDGHWRFIADLAQMAGGVFVEKIRVQAEEVREALQEAHHWIAAEQLKKSMYNAADIRNLKKTFGL